MWDDSVYVLTIKRKKRVLCFSVFDTEEAAIDYYNKRIARENLYGCAKTTTELAKACKNPVIGDKTHEWVRTLP